MPHRRIPDKTAYRLQKIAQKERGAALFLGLFLPPLAYLYVKDTGSSDTWVWFGLNLVTVNFFLLGFIVVPIHVVWMISSARQELWEAGIKW
jgi:uncharacterized membrane protein YqaE (UPF0057 family)